MLSDQEINEYYAGNVSEVPDPSIIMFRDENEVHCQTSETVKRASKEHQMYFFLLVKKKAREEELKDIKKPKYTAEFLAQLDNLNNQNAAQVAAQAAAPAARDFTFPSIPKPVVAGVGTVVAIGALAMIAFGIALATGDVSGFSFFAKLSFSSIVIPSAVIAIAGMIAGIVVDAELSEEDPIGGSTAAASAPVEPVVEPAATTKFKFFSFGSGSSIQTDTNPSFKLTAEKNNSESRLYPRHG